MAKRDALRASTADRSTEGADEALERRLQFLVEQSVDHAMDAPESWYEDGHLNYDLFAGLLVDALMVTVIQPILRF